MSRTFYKFLANPTTGNLVRCHVTANSKFIHFDQQGSDLFIWMEVESGTEPSVMRTFSIVGTGWTIESGLEHRATILVDRFRLASLRASVMDTLTIRDEETGIEVSVPVAPGTSMLSPAGRAALRIAEALLNQQLAQRARPR
jgi:hypothetical protein